MITNDTNHPDPPLPMPVRSPRTGRFRWFKPWRYCLVHDEQSGEIEEVSKARYDKVVAQHKAYEAKTP